MSDPRHPWGQPDDDLRGEPTAGEILDGETGESINLDDAPIPQFEDGRPLNAHVLTDVSIMWDPTVGEGSVIVCDTRDLLITDVETWR